MDSPSRKRKFLPGERFHPTKVELLLYCLLRMVSGKPPEPGYVAEVDIYKFHPAALKALAYFSEELNWYFFCSAGNKYKSGGRKKRTTPGGYWKPTGNDRVVLHKGRAVGHVKFLVFHEGKSPKGVRTDWIMHEYRLEPPLLKAARLKAAKLGNDGESAEFVVCKIFNKGGFEPRNGEQFGAAYNEEEWNNTLESILNENDPISADVNTTTTAEQVQSDVVSVSVVNQASNPTPNGDNAASTSNGVAFPTNPIAAPEIAPSSRDPVADPYDDKWCPDDFFDGLVDPTAANTNTTEQVRSDAVSMVPVQEHNEERFSAAEFGVPPINLADYPHISFDEFDL